MHACARNCPFHTCAYARMRTRECDARSDGGKRPFPTFVSAVVLHDPVRNGS